MSVYNHRPLATAQQGRVIEMLETIKADYDMLSQDVYLFNSQIQEMNNFQQTLVELERSQQTMKKHYEDEIARLRQQLDQVQTRGYTVLNPPSLSGQHPPTIGPSSNFFGGIINPHGQNAHTHQGPGLTAPQMNENTVSHSNYSAPTGPHSGSAYTPTPPQGSRSDRTGVHRTEGYGQPSIPVSAPAQPMNPMQVYGYPRMNTGTPTAQPMPPSAEAPSMNTKRKANLPPASLPAQPMRTSGKMIEAASSSGFTDADPSSVPSNMKVEGKDWFALFNPKAPRQLKVDLVHTLDQSSVVCCVKFSADGRYLAAGCNRSTIIYDTASGHRICVLQDESVSKDGDLYIRSVCFSPDGVYLATGAEDKQIRIWDITKRRICNVLSGHEQDIYSLDFSMDGRIIASGSGDCTARIWSMADGKCLHVLRIKDLDQKDPGVTSVAISPDGRLLAAGSLDKMVRIWDTQTGMHLERLEGHKDSVYSVAFMPDGNSLVSGSLDKTLKIWQLGTNEGRGYGIDRDRSKGPCKTTFSGHKDFVLSVACTPDGSWVVSGSKDRSVQFWDPRTGQTQFMLQGHKNSVISVAISPSGRPLFATGSGDNRARIWSYDTVGP
ncbi:WD40-repeat-containing domain protein [Spinellus fusiger]|nr:WD40-repeat-containing domain protein [Spinellus fusiger]